MASKENEVQRDVLVFLRYHGHEVWRNNVGRLKGKYRMGKAGLPDIIGFHRETGAFIAIECKQGKGKPSPEQKAFIERVRMAGGIAGVVRSLPDVLPVLADYENQPRRLHEA